MKCNAISEENIKYVLEDLAAEAPVPDHLFAEVMSRKESLDAANTLPSSPRHHSLNLLGGMATAACGVAVSLVLLFSFSSDVRAATVNAVNAVKSIFVVEQKEGKYVAVEKLAKEVSGKTGLNSFTKLSDPELSEKVGFKVSYPVEVYGNFRLREKTIGIVLGKQVDYEKAQQSEGDIRQAVTDDAMFEKLREYSPAWTVGGLYTNGTLNTKGTYNSFAISIEKLESAPDTEKTPTDIAQDINNIKFNWMEFPHAKYPTTIENNIPRQDRSKEPEEIFAKHSLHWKFNGFSYSLIQIDMDLSKEEAVKIAKSFMLEQK